MTNTNVGRLPDAVRAQVMTTNKIKKDLITREAKLARKVNKDSVRLDIFLEEFIKNGGNATQAALKVSKTTSLASAGQIGYKLLKEARGVARMYLEKSGFAYGKLLDVATSKMMESKDPEWWDRLMKIAGYEDFLSKDKGPVPVNVNVIQTHKDLTSKYIEGEEIEEVKDED